MSIKNKKLISHLSFILVILLVGCSSEKPRSNESKNLLLFSTGSNLLDSTLLAHGGAEKWKSYGAMIFTKKSGEKPLETHTIDLFSRKVLISSDSFKLGYDGKDIWLSPSLEMSPSRNPRFYHNLWFYFAAIPFVFTDPGISVEELSTVQTDSIDYNRIKITFGSTVGDSPNDQYILFTNVKTHRVELINYSVTYYDANRAESYNALVYQDYERFNGLLMPTRLTGYKWTDNQLGELRYQISLSNYQFQQEKISDSLFTKPANADLYQEPLNDN